MPPYLLMLLLLASWSWLGQVAAQPTARARWQVNITIDRSILAAFGDQQLLQNFVTQRVSGMLLASLLHSDIYALFATCAAHTCAAIIV
ncbi:hypothetical protein HaLaN_17774, partial [Haematococcus lacustris]